MGGCRGAAGTLSRGDVRLCRFAPPDKQWPVLILTRDSAVGQSFQPASLYPVLYRLERKGWIAGRWVETPGLRRRRYYRLTPSGRKQLAEQRSSWSAFLEGIRQTAGLQDA
jgi:hypothetical protein